MILRAFLKTGSFVPLTYRSTFAFAISILISETISPATTLSRYTPSKNSERNINHNHANITYRCKGQPAIFWHLLHPSLSVHPLVTTVFFYQQ